MATEAGGTPCAGTQTIKSSLDQILEQVNHATITAPKLNKFMTMVFSDPNTEMGRTVFWFARTCYPSVQVNDLNIGRMVAMCTTQDERRAMIRNMFTHLDPRIVLSYVHLLELKTDKQKPRAITPEEAGELTEEDLDILARAIEQINGIIRTTYVPYTPVQVAVSSKWNWRILGAIYKEYGERWIITNHGYENTRTLAFKMRDR